MPIYLYQCDSCGLRFEKMQRMSDEPLADCPECDGKVHRVIQPVGIIFKGSGFYVTDNRSGSSPTLSGSKEPDKSGAEKSDEKKESPAGEAAASTESKPKGKKAD